MEPRRVHSRWLEGPLAGRRSLHKVRLILGARQTGKTVLLERLLPSGRSLVYNLQDTRLRRRFESDPRAGSMGRTHAVTFWRTTTGLEVDYVWQSPDEHIPIEVKWTDKPRSVDASHVEKFLDTYPGMARRGFLVCRVPRAQQLTERTIAIPWHEL